MRVPVLVIEPTDRLPPLKCSDGVKPRNEPMLLPVNRCQSPISTARPNPVSVAPPRQQPNRATTGAPGRLRRHGQDALSNRSRRASVVSTVS
jgi:hypothetical protein